MSHVRCPVFSQQKQKKRMDHEKGLLSVKATPFVTKPSRVKGYRVRKMWSRSLSARRISGSISAAVADFTDLARLACGFRTFGRFFLCR